MDVKITWIRAMMYRSAPTSSLKISEVVCRIQLPEISGNVKCSRMLVKILKGPVKSCQNGERESCCQVTWVPCCLEQCESMVYLWCFEKRLSVWIS